MSANTFTLPDTMRINGLADVKDLLTPLIEAGEDLELDGSAVDSLDTSGLQLLIAAQKTMEKKGKQLSIVNPSETITQAIEICEAQNYLRVA